MNTLSTPSNLALYSHKALSDLCDPITEGLHNSKYYDSSVIGTSTAATGSYNTSTIAESWRDCSPGMVNGTILRRSLFCPKIGVQINERVGRKCWMHRIQMTGYIIWSGVDQTFGSGTPPDPLIHNPSVRVVLYMDTQNSSMIEATSTFLPLGSLSSSATRPIEYMLNLNFLSRYRILWDQKFDYQLSSNNDVKERIISRPEYRIPFKIDLDLENTPVNFNAFENEANTAIVDNSIRIMAICDQTNTPAFSCEIDYMSRVEFSDESLDRKNRSYTLNKRKDPIQIRSAEIISNPHNTLNATQGLNILDPVISMINQGLESPIIRLMKKPRYF